MKSSKALESVVIEVEAQLSDAVAEGVSAAVFAEYEVLADITDVFGAHDFVGGAFLEDAMLVDAGFMGKGILAYDGFISLDLHSCDGGDEVAGGIEFLSDDTGANFVVIAASAECHDDFFEGGISGTLPEAVDGAFDLASTGFDGREAVGDSESEVIVAVVR